MQNKKKMFRSQTFENYNNNKYSSIFLHGQCLQYSASCICVMFF